MKLTYVVEPDEPMIFVSELSQSRDHILIIIKKTSIYEIIDSEMNNSLIYKVIS